MSPYFVHIYYGGPDKFIVDMGPVAMFLDIALRGSEQLRETSLYRFLKSLVGVRHSSPCIKEGLCIPSNRSWASWTTRPAYWITWTVSMPDNSSKNQPQLVYISIACRWSSSSFQSSTCSAGRELALAMPLQKRLAHFG